MGGFVGNGKGYHLGLHAATTFAVKIQNVRPRAAPSPGKPLALVTGGGYSGVLVTSHQHSKELRSGLFHPDAKVTTSLEGYSGG